MIDLLYNDSILNSVKAQMPPAVCGVGQAELFRRSARRSSREDIGIEDQERGGGTDCRDQFAHRSRNDRFGALFRSRGRRPRRPAVFRTATRRRNGNS